MSFIRPQKRLAVQPTLKKEDVEGEVRAALSTSSGPGGWIYTNGVRSSAPAQASRLDNRNLAIRAGLKNDNKAVQTSVFPITARVAAPTGTASYFVGLPFSDNGVTPGFKAQITKWTMSFGNSATTAGTAKLFYTGPNKARVQVGAAAGQTWTAVGTGATAFNILFTETLASPFEIEAQGKLEVEIAITAGTAKDFVATIWCKHKHVR